MMDPEQRSVALPGWLLYGYTCVCMACVQLSGGQKDVSDSLELELQEVVSHLTTVLGTELWSSTRAECGPNP